MVSTGARPPASSGERRWKRMAMFFLGLTLILSVNSLGMVRGALGAADPLQTFHQVRYEVHDYDRDRTYQLMYSVPSKTYERHRGDVLPKLQIAAGNDQAYAQLVTPDEPVVREMARQIWEVAGGDDEKFVNMVLQVAHQTYYSLTPQAKSAVETLVEASGDCDPQAVLVASLLMAADDQFAAFDADVVLFLYWPYKGSDNAEVQWGHMQVGVHLDQPLRDARRQAMEEPSAYTYKGVKYYVAEPTFERGFNTQWRDGWRLGENWYPRTPDVVIEL